MAVLGRQQCNISHGIRPKAVSYLKTRMGGRLPGSGHDVNGGRSPGHTNTDLQKRRASNRGQRLDVRGLEVRRLKVSGLEVRGIEVRGIEVKGL